MTDEIKDNIRQMKEILREIYVFSQQYESIKNFEDNTNSEISEKEKGLLREIIVFLTNQLKILNNSIPALIERIGFYKQFSSKDNLKKTGGDNLIKIKYKLENGNNIELTINAKDKEKFLENLSRSRFAIKSIKKKYSNEINTTYKKPNSYLILSNKLFRRFSNDFIAVGYFNKLNRALRKINSRYVIGTYVSVMFLSAFLVLFFSIILFIFLLFFKISIIYPFVSFHEEPLYIRVLKCFWIILALPVLSTLLFYVVPFTEARELGKKIDRELPFVTIHMSAIASSGLEPVSIFKIILKGKDYKYTSIEFNKIMNLINFHGESIVNALRKISASTPSQKLKELLNGLAITITSGGELSDFLNQHAETMLFDYKLESERNNKISETFMDMYITIAIAAPMILLMMFVIIGSTGLIGNFFNLPIEVISSLLILSIIVLNIFFLVFLKIKQPAI